MSRVNEWRWMSAELGGGGALPMDEWMSAELGGGGGARDEMS